MKTVAVVIPCRNEEKYIGACIRSVLQQTIPVKEIFICDGLSTDGTKKIAEDFSAKHPEVKCVDNTKQTTPYALNLGIKNSTSDVVIILGAHAELDKDYVKYCLEVFEKDSAIGCAGGIIENRNENDASEIISLAMSSPFGVGNAHFRTGAKSGYVDTVAFGAYRKEVFEKAGYFDEELARNQDDEFNFRISKHGFKIYLDERIRSVYFVRGSYAKLRKQYYQYGFWKVYVNKKHKIITTIRQLFPALFILFLFSGAITSFFSFWILWAYLGVIVLYVICANWFAWQKTGNPGKMIQVIFVFFILHFAYGTGYWAGIFTFILAGRKPKSQHHELTR